MTTPTLYDWAGGHEALLRLTEVFYDKVLADPLLVPVFAHRLIPTRATSVRGRGAPDTVTSVLQRLIATVPVPLSTGS